MIEISGYRFPDDRHYDGVNHLWCLSETRSGLVLVGLDALGLASLGDLVVVAPNAAGTRVRRGEPMGTLEAAKMTGPIVAPVSGAIVEHNAEVLRDPQIVNRDPYGAGWLLRMAPSHWDTDRKSLIGPEGLEAWARGEIERYRKQGWID
jgi:glycine cleavage system H protein